MFSGTYCKKEKKKKPYYQLLRKIWWLPHRRPPTPDKGSIREIATGEITVSITPDDHLEGPYLLKTRELPGAPPPGPPAGALMPGPWTPRMRRIACFRHTHKIGLLAIIYNSFFSSFWSVCKTFFRRKSTKILARSLRSLDIIFLKFLVF